ncbi:MAG: hypothetical protein K9G34_11815, partial [Melioribacteraceae bacterium]|nr:hypothetical protein [Melioribacteraceae bacterium]
GSDEDPNSPNSGNTHQWRIWSMWVDYQEVKNDKSLFVSEFGFQGPANKETLEKVIPNEHRKVHDRIFEFHNKQVEGPERVAKFLSAHLPVTAKWDDYLYLAQLNQAFALKTCLEHWRTNGRSNGSIIWQLNDCWPVTSWAIVDSDLKPKMAYHFVKNIFTPQLVYFAEFDDTIEVRIQNQSVSEFSGNVELIQIDTTENKTFNKINEKVTLEPNQTKMILKIPKSEIISDDNSLLISRLHSTTNDLVNTNYFAVKKWKHYNIVKVTPSIEIKGSDNTKTIVISSPKAALFVDLYSKGIEFEDRGFVLLPGESKKIKLTGNVMNLKEDDIKIFTLNKYLT